MNRKTVMFDNDLSYANLTGTSLTHHVFQNSKFNDIKADKAHFSYSDLRGSQFRHAALKGAVFHHATLDGVDFSSADLTDCDFSYASLTGANFTGADLTGAIFDHAIDPP